MLTNKEMEFLAQKVRDAVKDLFEKSVDEKEEKKEEIQKSVDTNEKEKVQDQKVDEAVEKSVDKPTEKEKTQDQKVEIDTDDIINKTVDILQEKITKELSDILVKTISDSIKEVNKHFNDKLAEIEKRIATIEEAPTVRKSIDTKTGESPKEKEKDPNKEIKEIDMLITKAIAIAPDKVYAFADDIALWENAKKLTPSLEAVIKSIVKE